MFFYLDWRIIVALRISHQQSSENYFAPHVMNFPGDEAMAVLFRHNVMDSGGICFRHAPTSDLSSEIMVKAGRAEPKNCDCFFNLEWQVFRRTA